MHRVIVENKFGHWSAWFESHPEIAFGGETPGTATERLWDAHTGNQQAAFWSRNNRRLNEPLAD